MLGHLVSADVGCPSFKVAGCGSIDVVARVDTLINRRPGRLTSLRGPTRPCVIGYSYHLWFSAPAVGSISRRWTAMPIYSWWMPPPESSVENKEGAVVGQAAGVSDAKGHGVSTRRREDVVRCAACLLEAAVAIPIPGDGERAKGVLEIEARGGVASVPLLHLCWNRRGPPLCIGRRTRALPLAKKLWHSLAMDWAWKSVGVFCLWAMVSAFGCPGSDDDESAAACTSNPCQDAAEDCKVTSLGKHTACPSSLLHVDILSVETTCTADGLDFLVKFAAPVPLDPTQRFEMNMDLLDAAGAFAAGLQFIYVNSTQPITMSGNLLSPGSGDSVVRTVDGDIRIHLSDATLAAGAVALVAAFLIGSYDYNGGEDIWDESPKQDFPTCP